MTHSHPSPSQTDELRNQSAELVGQQIIIDQLHVPGPKGIDDLVLQTHGQLVVVVSQVELFTHLLAGTKYHQRFHQDERGASLVRNPHETFTFQGQGGSPAVSIVLPEQEDAIAVIKRVMTQNGDELTWSALLQQMGADPSHFKSFVEYADGIQTLSNEAQIRLQPVNGITKESDERIENPNLKVANLDSVTKLSRRRRDSLRTILPDLLHREQ